jgi:pimeloyl-ACP methyl ester carboxylesterase
MAPAIKSVGLPNQVSLPYIEQGDPSGVPVVLLHGVGDSWRSFEPVLPHLPESIHSFALTQRGHGDASRPAAGYRMHDFAADLAAFLNAVHLEAAVFVGHSMGSSVAQRFALCHPERTLGLVLVSSRASLRNRPGVQELWNSTISKLTDPVDPAFVRGYTTISPSVPQAFVDAMLQEGLKMPARIWKELFKAGLEDDLSGELDQIKAPTLILWGDQDVSTRGDQATLAAAIAGSRLEVYPGAGHMLHWEEPERFVSDLVAFVQGLGH